MDNKFCSVCLDALLHTWNDVRKNGWNTDHLLTLPCVGHPVLIGFAYGGFHVAYPSVLGSNTHVWSSTCF